MLYEACKVAADGRAGASIMVVDPHTSQKLDYVISADTDTGVLRSHVMNPAHPGHLKMTPWVRDPPSLAKPVGALRRDFVTETITDRDFDIVCRKTGDILHRYRVAMPGVTVINRRRA